MARLLSSRGAVRLPFSFSRSDAGEPAARPAPRNPGTGIVPAQGIGILCLAFLGVLTFLAYVGTLAFTFVHDDRGQIVGNPAVRTWHAVPAYFTAQVWSGVAPAFLGNDYRPFFLLWLRINDAIFGLHPSGWHLTTVLAHVLASFCVFWLARSIAGEWPTALVAALIFGLHPVHIEAVAWISGVPEPLVTAFIIAAYLCWLRSREEIATGRWLWFSLLFYTLALLTKESAVVLVLLVGASLGLDLPRLSGSEPQSLRRRFAGMARLLTPFLALTALYAIVRVLALKGFAHPAAAVSWLIVVSTWPLLLLFYLKLLVWPVWLAPFYGLQFVTQPGWRNCILPALALALVAAGLWIWARRSRPVALAIPWLVFPVLPVLNIQVFGDTNFAHNRYLYLPSVGFSILLALGLRRIRWGRLFLGAFPATQASAILVLASAGILAIQVEDRYYTNDAAFYSFAYSHMAPPDPVIGVDYANTLAEQGDYRRAAGVYADILRAHPTMWNAYFNLGYMEYQVGRNEEAIRCFSRAVAGDPAQAGATFYLGMAEFKLHRIGNAEAHLRRAVELAPASPNYHFALGMVLRVKGDRAAALTEFARELALDPHHAAAAQQAAEIRAEIDRSVVPKTP